ncbi:MAG TPA: CRISPR-associated endonuclease Cas3'', partial [Crocinitomix sp.]|nr:CRISPR-associated endonuclease Cas3'' [Crocinitomix sp.]
MDVILFDVHKDIWSHPSKPYKFHIQNIAQSFNDRVHKTVANFHDIGKLSDEFQKYIHSLTKSKTTHAIEGAYLYTFLTKDIDLYFLPIFFTILKHHQSLPNIKEEIYKFSNDFSCKFDQKAWIEKIASIERNLGVESDHNSQEFHKLFQLYYDNFTNFENINNFFIFKKCYSRLILADKFEAIFSKPYENLPFFSDEQVEQYI